MRAFRRCSMLATGVMAVIGRSAGSAQGTSPVIKSNGDPVPSSAYSVTLNLKHGGYDIVLTGLYAPGLESMFDIRANAGEYINGVVIDVDGPAAGSPVIVKV